jgi:CRP-like cAMP-binding protein
MRAKKRPEIPDCEDCRYKRNELFCGLDGVELEEISESKSHLYFKKRQTIFSEGSTVRGLYCIHKGKVKLHKWDVEGNEQIVRLARENQVLGYRALFSGDSYNTTATALEDCEICFIPKDTIMDLMRREPKMASQALKILTSDLKDAEERTVNMAHKHVRERIADTLLMLEEHYGLLADNETIDSSLTRREIGGIAGTTTETAIRVISDLRKEGVIDLNGKKIRILDHKQLERISEPAVL